MSDKQAALKAIRRLPDGVSFQEIRREIYFLSVVHEGEEQANQGKVIPLEEVEKNFHTWLSKS